MAKIFEAMTRPDIARFLVETHGHDEAKAGQYAEIIAKEMELRRLPSSKETVSKLLDELFALGAKTHTTHSTKREVVSHAGGLVEVETPETTVHYQLPLITLVLCERFGIKTVASFQNELEHSYEVKQGVQNLVADYYREDQPGTTYVQSARGVASALLHVLPPGFNAGDLLSLTLAYLAQGGRYEGEYRGEELKKHGGGPVDAKQVIANALNRLLLDYEKAITAGFNARQVRSLCTGRTWVELSKLGKAATPRDRKFLLQAKGGRDWPEACESLAANPEGSGYPLEEFFRLRKNIGPQNALELARLRDAHDREFLSKAMRGEFDLDDARKTVHHKPAGCLLATEQYYQVLRKVGKAKADAVSTNPDPETRSLVLSAIAGREDLGRAMLAVESRPQDAKMGVASFYQLLKRLASEDAQAVSTITDSVDAALVCQERAKQQGLKLREFIKHFKQAEGVSLQDFLTVTSNHSPVRVSRVVQQNGANAIALFNLPDLTTSKVSSLVAAGIRHFEGLGRQSHHFSIEDIRCLHKASAIAAGHEVPFELAIYLHKLFGTDGITKEDVEAIKRGVPTTFSATLKHSGRQLTAKEQTLHYQASKLLKGYREDGAPFYAPIAQIAERWHHLTNASKALKLFGRARDRGFTDAAALRIALTLPIKEMDSSLRDPRRLGDPQKASVAIHDRSEDHKRLTIVHLLPKELTDKLAGQGPALDAFVEHLQAFFVHGMHRRDDPAYGQNYTSPITIENDVRGKLGERFDPRIYRDVLHFTGQHNVWVKKPKSTGDKLVVRLNSKTRQKKRGFPLATEVGRNLLAAVSTFGFQTRQARHR